MAEENEITLDEVHYGPPVMSVPTAGAAAERRLRKRKIPAKSRALTPYNICCMATKILSLILIIFGIMVLILSAVLQPDALEVQVAKARLTVFNLSDDNATLTYNLFVNIILRNPNDKFSVHYDSINAAALFGPAGFAFGSRSFPKFHQKKKNTVPLIVVFRGSAKAAAAKPGIAPEFFKEEEEGFFSVDVKLYTKVKLRFWFFNSIQYQPDIDCPLRLPAPGNDTSAAGGFNVTKCDAQGFH